MVTEIYEGSGLDINLSYKIKCGRDNEEISIFLWNLTVVSIYLECDSFPIAIPHVWYNTIILYKYICFYLFE